MMQKIYENKGIEELKEMFLSQKYEEDGVYSMVHCLETLEGEGYFIMNTLGYQDSDEYFFKKTDKDKFDIYV